MPSRPTYFSPEAGTASDRLGRRVSSFSMATCASTRASCAPRQKWTPVPNATCGLGARATSIRSGSLKRAGSAFADESTGTTRSPRRIRTP